MIITISGMPGSGKSTVAEILAKRLKMKSYYMGKIRRELARKKGLTLEQLNEIGENEEWTDVDVDKFQTELAKKEDNFIIQGRTSFFLIPNSVKVFLNIDFDTGVKRIFEDVKKDSKQRNEGEYRTLEEAKKAIRKRIESDIRRYKKYYKVDIYDRSHYDIVIDTTDLMIEQVVEKVMQEIKKLKPEIRS